MVILGTMVVVPVIVAAAGLSIGTMRVPYGVLVATPVAAVLARWRRRLMQRDLGVASNAAANEATTTGASSGPSGTPA